MSTWFDELPRLCLEHIHYYLFDQEDRLVFYHLGPRYYQFIKDWEIEYWNQDSYRRKSTWGKPIKNHVLLDDLPALCILTIADYLYDDTKTDRRYNFHNYKSVEKSWPNYPDLYTFLQITPRCLKFAQYPPFSSWVKVINQYGDSFLMPRINLKLLPIESPAPDHWVIQRRECRHMFEYRETERKKFATYQKNRPEEDWEKDQVLDDEGNRLFGFLPDGVKQQKKFIQRQTEKGYMSSNKKRPSLMLRDCPSIDQPIKHQTIINTLQNRIKNGQEMLSRASQLPLEYWEGGIDQTGLTQNKLYYLYSHPRTRDGRVVPLALEGISGHANPDFGMNIGAMANHGGKIHQAPNFGRQPNQTKVEEAFPESFIPSKEDTVKILQRRKGLFYN